MYKRILVALDGSRCARRALDEAIAIAARAHAVVEAVSVVSHGLTLVDIDSGFVEEHVVETASYKEAAAALEEAEQQFREHDVTGTARMIDSNGSTVAEVLTLAAESCGADLIVMGVHGRRGLKRLLMGSVAEAVLRATNRPVLLVRAAAPESPSPDSATARSPQ
ncbi:universal stress protein [Paraburkholderia rhizosphaerae]|uniref:Nucleotide-binding universal stress UspA family protein n=1 Tax=Paraburkholderia rhizosphaerae TaxID=480658 RepID=A0A4R8LW95_9BURK|nr:universal stress protein [Paraburkholderia rhizosphaerae]TDY50966.1 nucleotide-binding universal stress UspA family protein [Paraburkholderia rhizosphaerae]